MWKDEMWARKGKVPKQDMTTAKDLSIELPEGSESPYHRLD